MWISYRWVYLIIFGKRFRKTNKNNWRSTKKKIDALKVLKPGTHQLIIKDFQQINQMKNKFKKNKEIKKMVNREDLIFEKKKHIYNFQQFKALCFSSYSKSAWQILASNRNIKTKTKLYNRKSTKNHWSHSFK